MKETFQKYISDLKNKCHPVIDEDAFNLLHNKTVLSLLEKCWDDGNSSGRSYGYEDGYEDGYDNYNNGEFA
jgi:hypothetical protein